MQIDFIKLSQVKPHPEGLGILLQKILTGQGPQEQ